MTDQTLVTRFESYLLTERRVARNTFEAYKSDIEQLMSFFASIQKNLQTVTSQDLKDFLKFLKESGITARSMARKISCIKTFFGFLHDHYDMKKISDQLILPKLERKLPHHLNEEDIQKLLNSADKDNSLTGIRNKVMLYLLYVSGARVSEIANLKLSNVDFSSKFLLIPGKGSKERMVPVHEHMLSLLRLYLDNAFPALLIKENQRLNTEFLFPTYYNKQLRPMTRQLFWMYLKKIAADAGIKKELSPHTLRHSLATHLLKNGADLRSLQLLLGHEQLTTVQIYTHVETSHLRKVYDDKHPRS